MKKFSIKGLAAVLGAAIFAGAKNQTGKQVKRISKPQNTEADFAKHIGLKEFEIEGEKFYAINYKNALKKYNKKHGINAVN